MPEVYYVSRKKYESLVNELKDLKELKIFYAKHPLLNFNKGCFILKIILAVLGLQCCLGLSLKATSRGSSSLHRLLTAVASLVAEHRL